MSVWTTKLRGPALGLTLASALAIAGPLQAAEGVKKGGSKQESIGVVSGMTVGALAGGPFGAVIGAAAGALMGDHYHKQLEDKKALAADLSQTQASRTRLQGDLALTQEQSEKLGVAVDRSRDLETSVGFRTNDSVPSDEDVVACLEKHVPRPDAAFDEIQHRFAGALAILGLVGRHGGLRGAVGQTHTKRFNRRGHGVRRVHAAAGTRARNGAGF